MQNFVFDFDGTIVDSRELAWEFISPKAEKLGYTTDTIREVSARELLSVLKIKPWQVPWYMWKVRRAFSQNFQSQPLYEGMDQALRSLVEAGCRIFIVSSNSKHNIEKYLEFHDADQCVEHVVSEFSLFGKAKRIEKLISDFSIDLDKSVYIGDEVRDIHAAQANNMRSVAVTWGYNSEKALKQANPDYVMSSPDELLKLVRKSQ